MIIQFLAGVILIGTSFLIKMVAKPTLLSSLICWSMIGMGTLTILFTLWEMFRTGKEGMRK